MGSFGAKKGQFVPKQALSGLLAAKKRPDTRPKSVVTMSPTHAQQPGGFGTKSGPSGPFEDRQDPQKGHFGPKRALLRPLGAKKRPNTRPKCVVTMTPTQSDRLEAVGTKSGPWGPSEDLQDPQKGLSGPKRAVLGALECSRGPLRGPSA